MALRVMVVDDALFMRNILKDIFVRHGYDLRQRHVFHRQIVAGPGQQGPDGQFHREELHAQYPALPGSHG